MFRTLSFVAHEDLLHGNWYFLLMFRSMSSVGIWRFAPWSQHPFGVILWAWSILVTCRLVAHEDFLLGSCQLLGVVHVSKHFFLWHMKISSLEVDFLRLFSCCVAFVLLAHKSWPSNADTLWAWSMLKLICSCGSKPVDILSSCPCLEEFLLVAHEDFAPWKLTFLGWVPCVITLFVTHKALLWGNWNSTGLVHV